MILLEYNVILFHDNKNEVFYAMFFFFLALDHPRRTA
eukprot:COSAG01_NODE_108_length_25947_cov_25.489593_31_plen_37_part_00